MEFRSTGQREVREYIAVLILLTKLGGSIDLNYIYMFTIIRFSLIFVNFRFIENSTIKLSVSS